MEAHPHDSRRQPEADGDAVSYLAHRGFCGEFITKLDDSTRSNVFTSDASAKLQFRLEAHQLGSLNDNSFFGFRIVNGPSGDRGIERASLMSSIQLDWPQAQLLSSLQEKDITLSMVKRLIAGLDTSSMDKLLGPANTVQLGVVAAADIQTRETALIPEDALDALERLTDLHWGLLEVVGRFGRDGATVAALAEAIRLPRDHVRPFLRDLEVLKLCQFVDITKDTRRVSRKMVYEEDEHYGYILVEFQRESSDGPAKLPVTQLTDVCQVLDKCNNHIALRSDVTKVLAATSSRVNINNYLKHLSANKLLKTERYSVEGKPETCAVLAVPEYSEAALVSTHSSFTAQIQHHLRTGATSTSQGVRLSYLLSKLDMWHARTKVEETLNVWLQMGMVMSSASAAPFDNLDTFTWHGTGTIKQEFSAEQAVINRRSMRRLQPGVFQEMSERRSRLLKSLLDQELVVINGIELRRRIQKMEQDETANTDIKIMDKKVLSRVVGQLHKQGVCRELHKSVVLLTGKKTRLSLIVKMDVSDDSHEVEAVCRKYAEQNAFRFHSAADLQTIQVERLVSPRLLPGVDIATGRTRKQLGVKYENARMERCRLFHLFLLVQLRNEIDRVQQQEKASQDQTKMESSRPEGLTSAASEVDTLDTARVPIHLVSLLGEMPLNLFAATIRFRMLPAGLDNLLQAKPRTIVKHLDENLRRQLFRSTMFKADSEARSLLAVLADLGLCTDPDTETPQLKLVTELKNTRRAVPTTQRYTVSSPAQAQMFWLDLKTIALSSSRADMPPAGLAPDLNIHRLSSWGDSHRDALEFFPELSDPLLRGQTLALVQMSSSRQSMLSSTASPRVRKRKSSLIEEGTAPDAMDAASTLDPITPVLRGRGRAGKHAESVGRLLKKGFSEDDVRALTPYTEAATAAALDVRAIAHKTGRDPQLVKRFMDEASNPEQSKAEDMWSSAVKRRKQYHSRSSRKAYSQQQDNLLLVIYVVRQLLGTRTPEWKHLALWALARTDTNEAVQASELPKLNKHTNMQIEALRRRLNVLQRQRPFKVRIDRLSRRLSGNTLFSAQSQGEDGTSKQQKSTVEGLITRLEEAYKELETIDRLGFSASSSWFLAGSDKGGANTDSARPSGPSLPCSEQELRERFSLERVALQKKSNSGSVSKQRRRETLLQSLEELHGPGNLETLLPIEYAQARSARIAVLQMLWMSNDVALNSALFMETYPAHVVNIVLRDLQREFIITQLKSRATPFLRPDQFTFSAEFKQQLSIAWDRDFLAAMSDEVTRAEEEGTLRLLDNAPPSSEGVKATEFILLEDFAQSRVKFEVEMFPSAEKGNQRDDGSAGDSSSSSSTLRCSRVLKGQALVSFDTKPEAAATSLPKYNASGTVAGASPYILSDGNQVMEFLQASLAGQPASGPLSQPSLEDIAGLFDLDKHEAAKLAAIQTAVREAGPRGITAATLSTLDVCADDGRRAAWEYLALLLRFHCIYRCDDKDQVVMVVRDHISAWTGTVAAEEPEPPRLPRVWRSSIGSLRPNVLAMLQQALCSFLCSNGLVSEDVIYTNMHRILTRKDIQDLLSCLMLSGSVCRLVQSVGKVEPPKPCLVPPSVDCPSDSTVSLYLATPTLLHSLSNTPVPDSDDMFELLQA